MIAWSHAMSDEVSVWYYNGQDRVKQWLEWIKGSYKWNTTHWLNAYKNILRMKNCCCNSHMPIDIWQILHFKSNGEIIAQWFISEASEYAAYIRFICLHNTCPQRIILKILYVNNNISWPTRLWIRVYATARHILPFLQTFIAIQMVRRRIFSRYIRLRNKFLFFVFFRSSPSTEIMLVDWSRHPLHPYSIVGNVRLFYDDGNIFSRLHILLHFVVADREYFVSPTNENVSIYATCLAIRIHCHHFVPFGQSRAYRFHTTHTICS